MNLHFCRKEVLLSKNVTKNANDIHGHHEIVTTILKSKPHRIASNVDHTDKAREENIA